MVLEYIKVFGRMVDAMERESSLITMVTFTQDGGDMDRKLALEHIYLKRLR